MTTEDVLAALDGWVEHGHGGEDCNAWLESKTCCVEASPWDVRKDGPSDPFHDAIRRRMAETIAAHLNSVTKEPT